MNGWVDGWMGIKAGLRIAYSNKKLENKGGKANSEKKETKGRTEEQINK